jgi:hypothetical protein
MTKQCGQALTLLLILLLTSCGKSAKEVKEEKEATINQKTEELKITNKSASVNLSLKFNAVCGWDTLEPYTYVFQQMFIDQKKPISFEGVLKDITKTDSTYILKVFNTGWHHDQNYIAQITLSPSQFSELNSVLQSNNHSKKGCFIFNVSNIVSVSPAMKPGIDSDGGDSIAYLDLEFNENLIIFKGELIDFYLNETVNKTDE